MRELIMLLVFFLPKEKQIRIERWLRGREENRKLAQADCVIVSFGKSGRTWLRVMLSRFYQVKHGLAERHLIGFDNLHRKNAAIPKIFFTHDNYLKDYTNNADNKSDYYDKKVVLMVRDPADVSVSQFFQWKFRMRKAKKEINDYPDEGEDVSLYDFIMRPNAGLPKAIDFLNLWAREMGHIRDVLIVRYEDMRAQPEATLARIVEFMGTPGTPEQIHESVEFASVENMRGLEQKRVFWLSGGRMLAKDRNNLNTYKVRRAKVGGYREDFTPEQLQAIDAYVESNLLPGFGYEKRETGTTEKVASA
jgi:hypothetical protein